MEQDKRAAELEQVRALEQEKKFEKESELENEIVIEEDDFIEDSKEQMPFENEMERAQRRRREVVFELALFFVLGVLLGITIKTEAVKRITIGFNDYQITKPLQSYNVAELKKALDDKIAKQQSDQQAAAAQVPVQQ